MPAPATSSRHLYTGHRQGSKQAAPRLRARRHGAPLSREFCTPPVLMPSFRLSMRQQWFTHVRLLVTHLTRCQRAFSLQRSPPRLLTGAACSGLGSPPARRTRRTCLHHWHSTVHAGDLLHRLTPLSGRTADRRIPVNGVSVRERRARQSYTRYAPHLDRRASKTGPSLAGAIWVNGSSRRRVWHAKSHPAVALCDHKGMVMSVRAANYLGPRNCPGNTGYHV